MTAYIITEDGRAMMRHGKYANEDNALTALFKRVRGCFEIRSMGVRHEPAEVTAEWLMANCREVELF